MRLVQKFALPQCRAFLIQPWQTPAVCSIAIVQSLGRRERHVKTTNGQTLPPLHAPAQKRLSRRWATAQCLIYGARQILKRRWLMFRLLLIPVSYTHLTLPTSD